MNHRGGAIYNVEGGGGERRLTTGVLVYGATKSAVRYFTRALAAEQKSSNIVIGTLEPGMVFTDALLEMARQMPRAEFQRARPFYDALTEPVETAAPKLVDRMLCNTKNGVHISLLPPRVALRKILSMPFRRRKLFAEVQA